MTLARWWVLHFLWLVPLCAVALAVRARLRARALERLADAALLPRLAGNPRRGARFLRQVLQVMALGLMIVALSGPRWGSHYEEVRRKGVDIVVAVDVSASMRVADISPSRLERAQREVRDFLRVVQGDRVGLVAFSGAAFLQCPLTLDYGAVQMFLGSLEPGLIPVPGTDLGAAVETALGAFDMEKESDRVILLITDGEDHGGRAMAAARRAKDLGVRIYVFGIGDPAGGPVPADDGGFRKDREGKMILSRLEEGPLQRIARVTGGRYVRSQAGDLDLDRIYFQGIKQETRAAELKSGKIRVQEERFALFVLGAFVALLLAGFLPQREKGSVAALFLAAVLPGLFWAGPVQAAPGPDALYRHGRYEEAEQAYAREDMDHPREVRHRYNRGCAAYKKGDFGAAASAFSSVLRRAKDPEIRYRAAFNRGNAAYRQGDFAGAVEHFKRALTLRPGDTDAAYNLELALRALEKQKERKHNQQQAQKEPGGQQREKEREKGGNGKGSHEERGPEGGNGKQGDSPGRQGEQGPQRSEGRGPARGAERGENVPAHGGKTRKSAEGRGTEAPSLEAAPGPMDPGQARALLDNVREDPRAMVRFFLGKKAESKVPSGKDW